MSARTNNTKMFALNGPPVEQIDLAGTTYRLVRVFKHDFWAITSLYEATGSAELPKIVVKIGRVQKYWGIPLSWYGRWLRSHEEDIYLALQGIEGIPRWVGRVGQGYAMEYIESKPLDHFDKPPEGFFDRLRDLFDRIHQQGVAYVDSNKRSNILVTKEGQPYLIDFQISLRRDKGHWPLRMIRNGLATYFTSKDIYHLYKHKRRMCPEQLTPEEKILSRRHGGLHWLHRKLSKLYRRVRRKSLQKQYEKGLLQSPTAELEDHYQPEKDTWRKK